MELTLAQDADQQLREIAERAREQSQAQRKALVQAGEDAADAFTLDEQATRALIDQQLLDRGWEADSTMVRYSKGARPAKGRNLAIAE